jgi:hypothetical protein
MGQARSPPLSVDFVRVLEFLLAAITHRLKLLWVERAAVAPTPRAAVPVRPRRAGRDSRVPRTGRRRKRRSCAARGHWKSLAHVRDGMILELSQGDGVIR